MIRPGTFDHAHVFSEDMAHQMNHFFQGKMGVTKGCDVSVTTPSNNSITIADGYFVIYGRILRNIGNTIVPIPVISGAIINQTLVYEIDLSKTNTDLAFNQGSFKFITTGTALIRQDLENGGLIYQMPLCTFDNDNGHAPSIVDTRPILSMDMYALNQTIEFDYSMAFPANFKKYFVDLWDGTVNAIYLSIRTELGGSALYLMTCKGDDWGETIEVFPKSLPSELNYFIGMGWDQVANKVYFEIEPQGSTPYPSKIRITPANMFQY